MELKQEQYEGEAIEDARTGEIIPVGEIQKPQSNTLATSLDLTKVGTLVLDEKAEAVLSEPLKAEDVNIRPDGLVYLPWTWFADRLNRAFGRLAWGLVPQAGPQTKDMGNSILVVWGHWLVVRGVPVGFEMGEMSYRPDNFTMSFGDAAAGAKSNSLARNCKMLGMSLELWNQEWVNGWRDKYAEQYTNPKNRKTEWRKKKSNGHQPEKKTKVGVSTKEELVETAVGYVPKEVWDEHAKRIAEDNDQSKEPVYEDLVPWAELRGVSGVKKLANESGKKLTEVVAELNKLDKSGSYSYSEIIKTLKGS